MLEESAHAEEGNIAHRMYSQNLGNKVRREEGINRRRKDPRRAPHRISKGNKTPAGCRLATRRGTAREPARGGAGARVAAARGAVAAAPLSCVRDSL